MATEQYPTSVQGWLHRTDMKTSDAWERGYERGKKAVACKHQRPALVHMKHDDRVVVDVPHLSISHIGYMPRVGVFGGDTTVLRLCLDCGQLTNWVAITDEQMVATVNGAKE